VGFGRLHENGDKNEKCRQLYFKSAAADLFFGFLPMAAVPSMNLLP